MKAGIFGYISKGKPLNEQQTLLRNQILASLAISSQDRGKDSTGIAIISNGVPKVLTRMLSGYQFVNSDEYQRLIKTPHNILIGGSESFDKSPKIDQIQPINAGAVKHVIGVHEGYIFNKPDLFNRGRDMTDAEVFIKSLWVEDNDYAGTIRKISGDTTGVWWTDFAPDRIFLMRNGFDIHFVIIKQLNTTFFSNSKASLQASLVNLLPGKFNFSSAEQGYVYSLKQKFEITRQKITTHTNYYGDPKRDTEVKKIDPSWIERRTPYQPRLVAKEILAIDHQLLEGCHKCKGELLSSKEFYFNSIKLEVRCIACGDKSLPKVDWKKYTDEDYEEMIAGMYWATQLSNNL